MNFRVPAHRGSGESSSGHDRDLVLDCDGASNKLVGLFEGLGHGLRDGANLVAFLEKVGRPIGVHPTRAW